MSGHKLINANYIVIGTMFPTPAYWVAVVLACALLAPVNADAQQYAPMLPLASRSLLLDIASAGSRVVVVGEHGNILYSDDGGDTWIQARVPTTQMLTSVYFADDRRGWAAGHDGLILVSDDAGANWRVQRDGIAAQQQINLELREAAIERVTELRQELARKNPGDSAGREDLQLALDDALLDLEDADIALQEPPFASPLMDIWFQDRQRGWAVGAFGTLLSTRNGGKQWLNQADAVDNPEAYHLNAVTGDGRGHIFIAGEAGVMFRSLDSGEHWETLPAVYDGSWFGTVYIPRDPALLVFGLRGHLRRSEDFGDSWTVVDSHTGLTLAGGSVSDGSEVVLVGAVGAVLRSRDGGRSFTLTTLPDRLNLSAAQRQGNKLILAGQGGIELMDEASGDD
jgi:photosystem II stability/assembly factor-like uncharacterized protein